ncbi:hypothetical protein B9G55_16835 [Saccharibacillus sp. O16]|nr:hypothetical protein B9G55_16835 [Saccharibacillus sp. O16]
MKFCTNCGSPVQEGEIHVCSQETVPAPVPTVVSSNPSASSSPRAALDKVDKSQLLGLLKNPLSALQLRGEADLIYGLIGLAASLIGFLAWAWSLKRNLIHSLYSAMGITQSWGSAYSEASEQFAVIKPMLITGLASLVFLMVGAILFGRWLGQNKASWKESLTPLGAVQLVSGAGFLVSALMLFVSLKFGLTLFIVVMLATLLLTAYTALQFFRIPQHRVVQFMALFVLLQVVAVLLAMDFSANQAVGDFKDSFMDGLL